jgi:hypothetical protein
MARTEAADGLLGKLLDLGCGLGSDPDCTDDVSFLLLFTLFFRCCCLFNQDDMIKHSHLHQITVFTTISQFRSQLHTWLHPNAMF